MTSPWIKKTPRTDAQWALSHDSRVRSLENATSTRVGEFVLNDVDGKLLASKPGQESFEIKAPEPVAEDTSSGGGAARMFRAATTAVVLANALGAEQVLPAGTFDTLEYGANGIAADLPTGSFGVTRGGMYTVVLRAQAASSFKSNIAGGDAHTITPLLYVNNVIREYGEPVSTATDGLFNPLGSTALFSRWTVRLSTGDLVQAGHRNDHLMDASGNWHRIIGDVDGIKTFLLIVPSWRPDMTWWWRLLELLRPGQISEPMTHEMLGFPYDLPFDFDESTVR